MPLIKAELIELLINEVEGYDCCIPRWNNDYLEPLFAIYPVNKALLRAKKSLQNKAYSLDTLLDKAWRIHYVSVENTLKKYDVNLLSLININGPIDIEKLVKFYK